MTLLLNGPYRLRVSIIPKEVIDLGAKIIKFLIIRKIFKGLFAKYS